MKFIYINGPCRIGKSTVSKTISDAIPLSYLLNIDLILRSISHYVDYPEERRTIRDTVAYGVIENVLKLGYSVVVDKMSFNDELVDSFFELAVEFSAEAIEVILWAPKDLVMDRASYRKGGSLTPERCAMFWDGIDEYKMRRPDAIVIDISEMNEREVFEAVSKVIGI